ncbi:MAG: hypothetical protein WAQ98_11095 [Blastocatellia bacterium]
MALLGYGGMSQETAADAVGQRTPAITAGASAQLGSGGAAAVTGSDRAGEITIVTGTGSPAAGALATINFRAPYNSIPHVVFQATEANAAGKRVYPASRTMNGFVLTGIDALDASTTYKFAYQVLEP